jgi:AraC-like DNA-binding protein
VSNLEALNTRILPVPEFLAALASPRHALELNTYGHQVIHKGWIVMRRAIPEHLLYLVDQHAMEGRVAGRPVRLQVGDFVWVSPGAQHEFRVPAGGQPFGMYHTKILLRSRNGRESLRLKRDGVVLQSAERIQSTFAELIEAARSDSPFADARRRALVTLLFTRALEMLATNQPDGPVLDARQRKALAEFFQSRIAQRPSPGDLAKVLRLNPEYFARVFRNTHGISPRAWMVRERLHAAARRLQETPLTISEIAYELGFKDVFLFSRQFSQTFGRSPRAYRKEV